MLKHPQELGFSLGLKLFIDPPSSIAHTPDVSIRDVVYCLVWASQPASIFSVSNRVVGRDRP
jgi:hypothetical protein